MSKECAREFLLKLRTDKDLQEKIKNVYSEGICRVAGESGFVFSRETLDKTIQELKGNPSGKLAYADHDMSAGGIGLQESNIMIETVESNNLYRILGIPGLSTNIVECSAFATPQTDARILYQIAKSISPRYILEIGTLYGHTTLGLALNCPKAIVYTMDICMEMGIPVPPAQSSELLPKKDIGKVFADKNLNIIQLLRDSREISSYSDIPPLDLCFIDGNHSFESIIADSLNVIKNSRKGAVIIWHDYKADPSVNTIEALNHLTRISNQKIFHVLGTCLAVMIVP